MHPAQSPDACPTCRKPTAVCVCDRVQPAAVRCRVVVLQHPREQDRALGTVPILERAVGADRRVGLSWPNFAAAGGGEGRWAVLWPNQLPRALTEAEAQAPVVRVAVGDPGPLTALDGIVALDGTWSQAKALWWRNPWLMRLDRLVVQPREPSIYGRLRREPRRSWVSTLEAVADALVAVGEPEEVRAELRRAMRTMVQRARDAGDVA
ncbi:MAG: tRNA-uridine aminocarboxypropyltransferase [Myxococcota bacterium]